MSLILTVCNNLLRCISIDGSYYVEQLSQPLLSEALEGFSSWSAVGVREHHSLQETHSLSPPGRRTEKRNEVFVVKLFAWVQFDCSADFFLGLLFPPQIIESNPHVEMCVGVAGIEGDGLPVPLYSLLFPLQIIENNPNVVVCVGLVGIEGDGLPVPLQGLLFPPQIIENTSHAAV
jgi:hypothetical protein